MNNTQTGKKTTSKKKKKTVLVAAKKVKKKGLKNKQDKKDKDFEDSEQFAKGGDDSIDRNDDSDGDYSDVEDEGADGYKPGGYHRVAIGDKFNGSRYTVLQKLGWGHFSTVWMVHDKTPKKESQRYVALKIQKSATHYREAAYDEISLLTAVSTTALSSSFSLGEATQTDHCVVELLDHFEHMGQNGRHVCMIFEVLGENLLSLIKKYDYKGVPIPAVKNIIRQMLVGLDFLHRHCKIIHTDLKPENILIAEPCLPPSPAVVSSILSGEHLRPKAAISEAELKAMTPEQRKKAKKKNKKKRQNAKKVAMLPDTSIPLAEQLLEMKLMEVDSEPSAGRGNKASDRYNDSRGIVQAQGHFAGDMEGLESTEAARKSDSSSRIPIFESIEDGENLWLRQTLFSELNFISEVRSLSGDIMRLRKPLRSYGFQSLPFDLWESPDESFYAKLTMITSVRKIFTFLGAPISDIVASFSNDDAMPLSSEEYCHVLSNSDWLLQLIPLAESVGGRTVQLDPGVQFTVRGHGFDEEAICELAACCLFEAASMHGDSFVQSFPRNIADAPVVWTVTHNAGSTEMIMRFLEERLPGVRFLYHLQAQDANLTDDDVEMSKIANSLCIHPLSLCNDEVETGMKASSAADYTSLQTYGSLIGLDLDLIAGAIRPRDDDPNWIYLLPPTNFLEYMRPLEDRYKYFIGELEGVLKLINSFCAHTTAEEKEDRNRSYFDRKQETLSYKPTERGRVRAEMNFENSRIKIVDLGNACYTYKHFTDDIQTRQYRSPEVILGADYDTSADIWSAACIVFELLTGDLMFDPRAGKSWDRDEDHLAMISELVGYFPKCVYSKGRNSSAYFTKGGELKHISQLKAWSLRDVLHEKYKFSLSEADDISSFLLPMLEIDPSQRVTACDILNHPWLTEETSERPQSSAVYLSDPDTDCDEESVDGI